MLLLHQRQQTSDNHSRYQSDFSMPLHRKTLGNLEPSLHMKRSNSEIVMKLNIQLLFKQTTVHCCVNGSQSHSTVRNVFAGKSNTMNWDIRVSKDSQNSESKISPPTTNQMFLNTLHGCEAQRSRSGCGRRMPKAASSLRYISTCCSARSSSLRLEA